MRFSLFSLAVPLIVGSGCARAAHPPASSELARGNVASTQDARTSSSSSREAPPPPSELASGESTSRVPFPPPSTVGPTAPSESDDSTENTASGATATSPTAMGPVDASSESPSSTESNPKVDFSKALPELSVRHIGMHIGGESNSPDSKKPLLKAIEKKQTSLLSCYRLVSSPGTSGTFGIDLFIPTEGGAPEIKKMRHKIGGFEFEACMHRAFENMKFPARTRPTMVSYSLRYEFKK